MKPSSSSVRLRMDGGDLEGGGGGDAGMHTKGYVNGNAQEKKVGYVGLLDVMVRCF